MKFNLMEAMEFKLVDARLKELFEQWCKDNLSIRIQTKLLPPDKLDKKKVRIRTEVSLLVDEKIIKTSYDVVSW